MTYRLLSTGRGVPLALAPEHGNSLQLSFENAPDGASAYLKLANGAVFYKEITDGKITIDLSRIAGEIRIGVVSTKATTPPGSWDCGALTVVHTIGGTMVAPSAADLAEQVRRVMLEAEEIREKNNELSEKLDEVLRRLDEIYEGYDFI